jgi:hypothetical protein
MKNRSTTNDYRKKHFLLLVAWLAMAGCRSSDPAYISQLRESAPPNALPTGIKTNGPFSRPILRVAIHENRAAVVTQSAVPGQYVIWTTNDLQNWGFSGYTPALPSALLPLDKVYWFAKGSLNSEEIPNPPQSLPFPYEEKISELIPHEDGLLAVAGTAAVYGMSEAGRWSEVSTIDQTEHLTSLTKTSEGICAIASTNRVWFWNSIKTPPVLAATIPVDSGSLKQVTSTTSHSYMLTDKGLLEGDSKCDSWKPIPAPSDTGERYSIAGGRTDVYLATQSGLYKFDGTSWVEWPSTIARAMIRRLRAIDGTLYACHAGGMDESDDLGHTWKRSSAPIGVGPAVGDILKYRNQLYAVTDRGLYKRETRDGVWRPVTLPTSAPVILRGIAAVGNNYLIVEGEKAPDINYVIVMLDSATGHWLPAAKGLEFVHGIQPLQTINDQVYAATDKGLFRFDPSTASWIEDPFNAELESVPVVARFKNHGLIIATAKNDLWYTEDATAPHHTWRRFLDTSSIKNTPPLNDIWSNPADSDDTFITSWGRLLYSHAGQLYFANPPEYGQGFSFASLHADGREYLFLGNDFGVDYIDRRRIDVLSLAKLEVLYQRFSVSFWFWPIAIVVAFIGIYSLAVLCVLILLYSPLPRGLLGTEWLITFVAKSLTISPLLGRWILFIGYRGRLQKILTHPTIEADCLYSLRPTASVEDSQGIDTRPLTIQVATCLSLTRFVLVEHHYFPSFAEYLALECLTRNLKGTVLSAAIPIVLAGSQWKDGLVASASAELKNVYSVPIDSGEMLTGQMERGKLLFICRDLDELGDSLASVLNEIHRMVEIERFDHCYFVGCCKTTDCSALNLATAPFHVVATHNSISDGPKVLSQS